MNTQPYKVKFGDRKEETFHALSEGDLARQVADAASGREMLRKLDPHTPVVTTRPDGQNRETMLCEHWHGWPSPEDQEAILSLAEETDDRIEAICAAYGDSVRNGSIQSNCGDHGVEAEAYARALWAHGKRNGWLT